MANGEGRGYLVSCMCVTKFQRLYIQLTQYWSVGQKLYSKQTVYDAHLTSKKHLKASAAAKSDAAPQPNGNHSTAPSASSQATDEKAHVLASLEAAIKHLLTSPSSPLLSVRSETKSNVERKASLTDRERALELEEMEAREAEEAAKNAALAAGGIKKKDAEVADDDEEERIYNPLKLPLGWDGKPIPYVRQI